MLAVDRGHGIRSRLRSGRGEEAEFDREGGNSIGVSERLRAGGGRGRSVGGWPSPSSATARVARARQADTRQRVGWASVLQWVGGGLR